MVIDSSAVIAALRNEVQAELIRACLNTASERYMSAVSVYETRIVLLHRADSETLDAFEYFLREGRITISPFDEAQAFHAARAYRQYGKGMGHSAQLNMGDCAAYALAKSLDMPLLYIGNDFARTDVTPAL